MTPAIDARVRRDTHPTHPSTVQAVLTGPQPRIAPMTLEVANWNVAITSVMFLAGLHREEPYLIDDAAKHLIVEGTTP